MVFQHRETGPIVEVPHAQRAVPAPREQPPPRAVKGHGGDLRVTMATRELDGLLPSGDVPDADHTPVTAADHLGSQGRDRAAPGSLIRGGTIVIAEGKTSPQGFVVTSVLK